MNWLTDEQREFMRAEAERAQRGECETPGCRKPAVLWWKGDPIEATKHCLEHYDQICAAHRR